MVDLYIVELYKPERYFPLRSLLRCDPRKKACAYVCSRSFKVMDIDANRKPICDFVLVFHYNYMVIF